MDLAVGIIQLLSAFAAVSIYGTERRPRHPAVRMTFRLFVFAGFPICYAGIYLWHEPGVLLWVSSAVWVFCLATLITAEFELSISTLIPALATALGFGLIALGIWSEVSL